MQKITKTTDAFLEKYANYLIMLAMLLIGLIIRAYFLPYESHDMSVHLENWMQQVRDGGGVRALGTAIGDYTPAYMLLIALTSYLPFNSMLLIKLISIAGDLLLATATYLLVLQLTKSVKRASLTASVIFLLPTVFLNSSAWGQCDAIFTSFLLLFLYFFFKNKPYLAMGMYWAALAFKLQAIFLLPLVFLLFMCKRLKLRHILAGAVTYVLLFLPSILMGRGVSVLWRAYTQQAGSYAGEIALNIPNLYTWFVDEAANTIWESNYVKACVFFGIGIIGLFLFVLWQKRDKMDNTAILYTAMTLAFFMPNVLPKMHDRYFFAADILAMLVACCFMQKWYLGAGAELISLSAYVSFLFRIPAPMDRKVVALGSILLLAAMCWLTLKQFGFALTRNAVAEPVADTMATKTKNAEKLRN